MTFNFNFDISLQIHLQLLLKALKFAASKYQTWKAEIKLTNSQQMFHDYTFAQHIFRLLEYKKCKWAYLDEYQTQLVRK